MAGVNQAANLSGMLSQISDTLGRERDISSLTRGIENTSRPNVDPNNAAQLEGLMNWQQRMGREEAARTTLARVEQVKAEQQEATAIEAARKQADIRGQMDKIARDTGIPQEEKQIRLRGLQASLNALSTTEQQINLNSGYDVKTLNGATQEATAAAQESREVARFNAANAEIQRESAERSALNTLSSLPPEDREEFIAANQDHAAVLTQQSTVLAEGEYRRAEANDYFTQLTTGPDLDWIEETFSEESIDTEVGKLLLKQVKETASKHDGTTWKTTADLAAHKNAIKFLNEHIIKEKQGKIDAERELDSLMNRERLKLEANLDRPSIGAVEDVMSSMLGTQDWEDLDEKEQDDLVRDATERASILSNQDAYIGLANIRMSQDPTTVDEEELAADQPISEFERYRKNRIVLNRGAEPGGQEETLRQFNKRIKDAIKEQQRAEEETERRSVSFSNPIVREAFMGYGQTAKPSEQFDYGSLVDPDSANIAIKRINLAPRHMGIYENSFITQGLRNQ